MKLPLAATMTNQEIAAVFKFIGGVLELQGADGFRTRAYKNAASVIEQLPEELKALHDAHSDLTKLPGIGKTLAAKLHELFTSGTIAAFDEYTASIPVGVWSLSHISGLGVKKAYKLMVAVPASREEDAIPFILEAAQSGKIRAIEGFGEKSEQELIGFLTSDLSHERIPWDEAQKIATALISELKKCPAIVTAEALGSLRRHNPTIGDIDIGLSVNDIGRVKSFVKTVKSVKSIKVAGDQSIRLQLTNNFQVDLKVATPAEWGSFLQHFTGSKEHNIRLREFAKQKGMSLSEHGITFLDEPGNPLKTYSTEEAFYQQLGLNWIPPEQRLGSNEIERFSISH
jgi:DNA polymerase (family 10)